VKADMGGCSQSQSVVTVLSTLWYYRRSRSLWCIM